MMINYDVVELKVPSRRAGEIHTVLPEGYRPYGAPVDEGDFHFPAYVFHRTLTDIERLNLVQGLDLIGGEVVSVRDIKDILKTFCRAGESQSSLTDSQAGDWGTMASPTFRLG